ncbi:AAA family ATPase [Persephonella atlantica]|uniref:AAA family ATPase n=1 Tax=Persephonella atlantica TaxID=2699429 RepID=A0ABS1GFK7_9AQUI|nr:AAA family ATPase [Persephonella atlantica]MBK3331702.1 AAA family ATPase [Persephonella atlantica]
MAEFLEFFAFKDDPFRITPDVDFFYMSSVHQEALSSIEYVTESGEGFAVIIGEPGTGKTITIRKFLSRLPESVEYAYILFPNLSPEEMFRAVLEDFGIEIDDNVSKNKLFSQLRNFLIKKKEERKKVLIIVDEAQNLPVETLEELRILSNLETDKEKLLQIILLGQPELERKLNLPELRQLKQRITVFFRLRNLSKNEMVDYINYRLAKAGNSSIRIEKGAYNAIYRYSNGNLRTINLIMERALMSAFVSNRHGIKKEDVLTAVDSLGLKTLKGNNKKYIISIIMLFIILAVPVYFYNLNNKDKSFTADYKKSVIKRGFVKVNKLNMRKKPSGDAEIIYVLRKGDSLDILEGREDWLKVRYKNITGWVNKKYVGPIDDKAGIRKSSDLQSKTY